MRRLASAGGTDLEVMRWESIDANPGHSDGTRW